MKKIIFYSRYFLLVIGLVTVFVACKPPVETAFQKQVAIPEASWDYKFMPTFNFNIPDSTSKYKVFLIFRYDASFEFSNIWVRLKIKGPGDSTYNMGNRIETVLLTPDGSRLGNYVGGMYEYKIQLSEVKDYPVFKKSGDYSIQLEQVMRKNPLPGLINIGLRVESVNTKKPIS
ncbi:MAG TPA: gliding motility lipoprotein GldH [Edaphocola sp.]|nr:gliding motility lipoprotein GldH [Edaphocola sp.]